MNGHFFYVARDSGFDVVFAGGDRKDYFPEHVAHTESKKWAERLCKAFTFACPCGHSFIAHGRPLEASGCPCGCPTDEHVSAEPGGA